MKITITRLLANGQTEEQIIESDAILDVKINDVSISEEGKALKLRGKYSLSITPNAANSVNVEVKR
jgi:hypothetical protein